MGIQLTPSNAHGELVVTLAHAARREGILCTLWQRRGDLTLERLGELLHGSGYAEDIGQLTVGELIDRAPWRGTNKDRLVQAFLRRFEHQPNDPLTSQYFVRCFGISSWTAQKILGDMAERGLLRREGRTSDTRYRLTSRSA